MSASTRVIRPSSPANRDNPDAEFAGFKPAVFDWFAGLERDNSRAYFAATRERYELEVRGGLEAMLDELRESFGGEVKLFRPCPAPAASHAIRRLTTRLARTRQHRSTALSLQRDAICTSCAVHS